MPDDHPRLAAPTKAPRARLVAVIAACAAVVLVGTSILNRSRWTLACEDGELVAYRGLSLPIGRGRLDPDAYPAIAVPPAACEDTTVTSREELDESYVAATMHRVDSAIRYDDASELESAAQAVDRLVDRGGNAFDDRKRSLIVALLRADLRAAASALGRARARMDAAEEAGVAPEVLRALALEQGTLCASQPVADPPALVEATPPTDDAAQQEESRSL